MTDKTGRIMKDFWDAKARENAMYYISSYRPYDEQDPEEFWKWGGILAQRLLDESGISFTGEETMLEIGCGVGRMSAWFAERFKHVHGIDVSEEMIQQAHENLAKFSNVTMQVGSGSDLACYDDASFDFVFSYITFQHIPDAAVTLNYIREAGRVLRAGGHSYFQVNNLPAGLRSHLQLGRRLRTLLGRGDRGDTRVQESGPHRAGGPRDLDHPAWRGSRVTLAQVEGACREGGMHISSESGKGTQYLWIKAVKRA